MKTVLNANLRLKEVLNKDKNIRSERIVDVIKSDLLDVLQNYFIFEDENLKISITSDGDKFIFNATCDCEKIKPLNYLR